MKRSILATCISFAASSLLLGGCGGAVSADGPLSTDDTSSPLYVKDSALWGKKVSVCWEDASSFATERGWVRDILLRTWERQTGIQFVGWGQCVANGQGIHIQVTDYDDPATPTINEANPRTEALGTGLNRMSNGMKLNFTYNNWDPGCQTHRQDCIEQNAVHEFGHAIGLSHEQNRPDTPGGVGCNRQGEDGTRTIGDWDRDSVMSYCTTRPTDEMSVTDIAGARTLYDAPVKLINGHSGYCLGVVGIDGHGLGAAVEVYSCAANSGDPKADERWSFMNTTNGYFRLVNKSSGLCLGVVGVDDSNAVGAAVEVYDCEPNGGDAKRDEEWRLYSANGRHAQFQNRASNLCLGVQGVDNHAEGARVEVYHCSPGGGDPAKDEMWTYEPVAIEETTTRFADMSTGLCLGVQGVDSHGLGTLAETYDCGPAPGDFHRDSDWTRTVYYGGAFSIVNRVSGLCLGVQGWDSHGAGALTEVYDCNAAPYQDERWRWSTLPSGQRQLKNEASGLCLSSTGYTGAPIEVTDCSRASAWTEY